MQGIKMYRRSLLRYIPSVGWSIVEDITMTPDDHLDAAIKIPFDDHSKGIGSNPSSPSKQNPNVESPSG